MLIKHSLLSGRFLASTFATIIMLVTFTGCGGGGGGTSPPVDDGYVEPPPVETPTLYATAPTSASTSLGQVLVNADSMTLYTFENDRTDSDADGSGDSDCNASCASSWPPMLATSSAQASGAFSIILRDDTTSMQWAYNGMPLYMFASDSAAGDVSGEGLNNLWFVARPSPVRLETSANAAVGTIVVSTFTQTDTDGSGGQGSSRMAREGFTLYTFENDRNDSDGDGIGDSDCNANCAEIWPPLFADRGATATGDYSIIERDDGTMQWALNDLPLYFYASDSAAGETNGDGVGDIWYVARPTPFAVESSSIGGILVSTTSVFEVDGAGAIDTSTRNYEGFSLYVFDNDVNDTDGDGVGDSDCNGGCAVAWPPFYADFGAVTKGDYSIISRDDGTRQWTFKGEPLYFFAGDNAAGDVSGDQVGDNWFLARPAPIQIFTDSVLGDIFSARGLIRDVDSNGNMASTSSDKTGYTVYLFDDDATDEDGDGAGDSDCNDSCAVAWPPLYAQASDIEGGGFTIITRDDGSLQWAYQGAPLYFYVGDTAPEMTAGIYGTWHEVYP